MRPIEWLAVLALALLWGVSFLLMELAIPAFTPFTLVFIRVALAAALMLWLVRRSRALHRLRRRWRLYALLGFFGSAFPFLCFAWGQRYIESGLASVLNALTPLAVLGIALMTGREQYDRLRAAGIFIGFIGVGVLMDPDASASEWHGILAATLAAFSYAVATSIAWAHASRYDPRENACNQLLFACLYMLPFALYEQPWQAAFDAAATAALFCLSFFSTFCAYLVYYFLLRRSGGVNAMLAILLIPMVAVALGIVFLGERFDSGFFAGGAMIIAGIICTDHKLRRFIAGMLYRKRPIVCD